MRISSLYFLQKKILEKKKIFYKKTFKRTKRENERNKLPIFRGKTPLFYYFFNNNMNIFSLIQLKNIF